ncbi:MAG: transcriptional regulator, partial [Planctomycetales bacterium]|nr:transcriptional regulator [Planctomycetales bacterium]
MPQTIDREQVEALVRSIVRRVATASGGSEQSPVTERPSLRVSISARHVHLTDAHVEQLFGKGHRLTPG